MQAVGERKPHAVAGESEQKDFWWNYYQWHDLFKINKHSDLYWKLCYQSVFYKQTDLYGKLCYQVLLHN